MQLPASFSLPKLIPLSQVWQLESKSSMSQFAQLQVCRGGVTQSINQNKITKCAINKKLTCQVAEQMTLLDSQLFQLIDLAELLTWVQEQVPLDFISIMIIIVTATSFPALYLVGKTTSLSGGGEEYELDEVHRALQQHVLLDAHQGRLN